MSKQVNKHPSINKIQLRSTAPRLTKVKISARKATGKIDGWFAIANVGRPAKAPVATTKVELQKDI